MTTVSALLSSLSDTRGDAMAIVRPGGEAVTFAALRDRVASLGASLRAQGVRRGDRITAFLPNSEPMVELFLAVGCLGAVFIGINSRFRADDLRHALEESEATFLFSATDFLGIDFPGVVAGALAGMERPPRVVWPDELERFRLGDRADIHDPDARPLPDDAEPDDLLVAFSTTGTTGRPKLAAHDHASTLGHAQAVARALDIDGDDIGILSLPMCGAFGLTSLLSWMVVGAGTVVPERFEPVDAASLIERYGVTRMNGSDDMMLPVLAAGSDLRSWRQGVQAEFTGSSARAVAQADAIGVCLSGGYGSSELFAMSGAQSPAASPAQRARNGGMPVDKAMSVRVADMASGTVLGPDTPGELQFRGPAVVRTYLGNPEATARAFTEDGWFRSGDLGETYADGSFVYLARLRDSLRLAGFLTDPAEIEQRFLLHPRRRRRRRGGSPRSDRRGRGRGLRRAGRDGPGR